MEPAACSIQLGLLSQEQIDEIQKFDTISRCYLFNDSFSFESVGLLLSRLSSAKESSSSSGVNIQFKWISIPKLLSPGLDVITQSISKSAEALQLYFYSYLGPWLLRLTRNNPVHSKFISRFDHQSESRGSKPAQSIC